ncbi:four-carbon acid sugar kinase family protein [Streptomyces sp. A7024]|uniref:Four-carbon acid sugar kinase family protein n=1 Tax=Streptomyces coryli TaxID=1128680 RepID=A0A6G4U9D6_9ACTN|nr:four-carbon acid sugar kinase family protein [Streptomyces coryli]
MTGAPAVLVVADDLTGANATAAGFARVGLRAVTVGAGQDPAAVAELADRFDAVVVSTDSRHCPPAEAARRVAATIAAAGPARLVSNRVDSTLRGNPGASTAAALEAVRAATGRRAVALCAPAHPGAGRHTVQGTQLLDGVRLEETELARDPRSPLPTSDVAALLRRQADLRITHLPLAAVTGDPAELRALAGKQLATGTEVIVADALTADHLRRAAAAAVAAGQGEIAWVGVDSGPGSVALALALGLGGRAEAAPLLAVSGSATALTRTQLARLRAEERVHVVRPVPYGRGPVPDVAATAAVLGEALAIAGPGEVVLLATVLDEADVVPLSGPDAEALPAALARAVRAALEHRPVDGVFATGGDVSAALFAELGALGLDVEEELVPLAVAGSFVAGPWAGLPVVTKGGLVGDAGTTLACVAHLRRAAAAARRLVPAARTRTAPQHFQQRSHR